MPNSLEYQPVECSIVVNAAGAFSAKLAEMLGVGVASTDVVDGVAVPVEPRKRSEGYFHHLPMLEWVTVPLLVLASSDWFGQKTIKLGGILRVFLE